MTIRRRLWMMAALVALSACAERAPDRMLVARTGDHELTVDRTVELLVDAENLPANKDVIRALADLWIDYTLLADAAARDSTLESVDVGPMVREQLHQEMVFALRDSVIQVDTAITASELKQAYESQSPDAKLRARHILMTYPPGATTAQKDSVRSAMEKLLRRARGGEDFAALARRYSQDPGSAPKGGELGEFGRGQMVKPFEDAVFRLQPGEISDVVETPFGLHIIQLEERHVPALGEVAQQFRTRMQQRRYIEAESTYVAGLEARAHPEVTDDALELTRGLAKDVGARLSRRAARRALVKYEGGAFTAGEIQEFLQGRPTQFRTQLAEATDEQIRSFLSSMAQREILIAEARAAGLAPTREHEDSVLAQARERLRRAADQVGVLHFDPAPGEPLGQAVDRAVDQAIEKVVSGARNVVPLGQISFELRRKHPATVFDAGIGEALLRISSIRATRSPSPVETPTAPQASPPDTAGS